MFELTELNEEIWFHFIVQFPSFVWRSLFCARFSSIFQLGRKFKYPKREYSVWHQMNTFEFLNICSNVRPFACYAFGNINTVIKWSWRGNIIRFIKCFILGVFVCVFSIQYALHVKHWCGHNDYQVRL